MKLGYARVSTEGQELSLQTNALKESGVEKIYTDKKSGKNLNRAGLTIVLSKLQYGDTLVVTKMDRIARNVTDGISLIEELNDRGITLHVLNMGSFDNSPTSRLLRNILLSVADWEREMMLERQREGIALAKAQGKYRGRVKTYSHKHKGMQEALKMFADRANNKMSVKDICETYSVGRTSLYKIAREQERVQMSQVVKENC